MDETEAARVLLRAWFPETDYGPNTRGDLCEHIDNAMGDTNPLLNNLAIKAVKSALIDLVEKEKDHDE